jgi:hypothetical protein
MCKNWVETGRCKFGNGCSFAHGREELQNKDAVEDKAIPSKKDDT